MKNGGEKKRKRFFALLFSINKDEKERDWNIDLFLDM